MAFLKKSSAKWLILFLVFTGAIAFIFILNNSFYNDFLFYFKTDPVSYKEKSSLVRITVDFSDGRKRAFEGKVLSAITAFEALRAAQAVGGFSLNVTLAGDISDIEGVRADGKRWRWYLNGAPEGRPILDVPVSGGDKILVKYE